MYNIENNNQLTDKHKVIKILKDEEIESAKFIIDILNNFNLDYEDINLDRIYDLSDMINPSKLSLEEIEEIAIPLLILAEERSIDRILENNNLETLIETLKKSGYSLYKYTERSDFEDFIHVVFTIPDQLEFYIDYDRILNDMNCNGEINHYNLKYKDCKLSLAKFMIQTAYIEDFLYEIESSL